MEHAKRMVLVDEKMLDGRLWHKPIEHLLEKIKNKQDLNWKRPTEHSAKSVLSKQMKSVLNDDMHGDDVKAKQYQQTLSRFLHTNKKLPEEPRLIDFTQSTTADDLLDLKINSDVKPLKKKKKTKPLQIAPQPTRTSKRLKKDRKLFWEDY
jgi:hypothetical protein